ncbi:uncharacterized protein LOC111273608 isoform X2 [Varroa jacobsoni]|uniref:FAM69 protein-kinase domain-containing protein n=1 Tax=Varroa destructor TaxID=109461 RepID=A0A7M7KFL3_VARDE|nr:uncharacterized protein LOC111250983 isoform X2 [Varroa destructor]XP_022711088.1 uncharacterized protein LOC111273608 isoform X2 [Varroa jacobsoni]
MRFRFYKRAILLSSVVGLITIAFWSLLSPSPCEEATLDNVCRAWRDGKVDGDWCFQLCEQTSEKSCDNLIHFGKRVVVRLRGPFGKAVAKSRNLTWTSPDQMAPPLRPTDPIGDFQERMRLLIENIYTIRNEELLWNRISAPNLTPQQRTHFLQLLEQREFVWSYLFSQDLSPFPRVRGTCAHLFIVEEADIELGLINSWPLEDRLTVAIKLVDLTLERLGVQMCDLKWEHFGIGLNLSTSSSLSYSEDFRYQHPPTRIPTDVKLLDLDAVLSESSLKLNMDSTPCETDEDCDYFDCKGRCVQRDFANGGKPICKSSTWDSNLRRLLLMLSGSLLPPQRPFFRDAAPSLVRYISNRCLSKAPSESRTVYRDHCNPHSLRQLVVEALLKAQQNGH